MPRKPSASLSKWILSLGSLGLLALVGFVYERRAQKRFRDRYTPPGRLYDVSGHKMHLLCMGERKPGQPLVVLLAGHGSWSSCWQKVMPTLASRARVCAYDRAGYGWSDPSPGADAPERMVIDLRALLREAGESGPFLLVGHSMGGALARLYATLYPDEVAGMVWVDSVQEDLPAYLSFGRWAFPAARRVVNFGALLAEMGLIRGTGIGKIIARYPSVDAPLDAGEVLELVSQPGYLRVVAAEIGTLANRQGWQGVRTHFGSLPVTSLEALYAETPPNGFPPKYWQRFREGWHAMHEELTVRADAIQHIPVQCGHVIMNERPDLVIDAIFALLERLAAETDHQTPGINL